MAAVLVVAAACLVISASYLLYDTDLWQHLAMGKAIWSLGSVPQTNLWTWPHYGEPYFLSSWLFRALIWPIWSWGGIAALYAFRWLGALAVFSTLFAVARVMGARGLSAVLVLVWMSLAYRLRTDVRPETLASFLFALELLILERARRAPPNASAARRQIWWIVPIVWLWANLHVSFYLGFVLLGFYGLDAWLARARRRDRAASGPGLMRLLSIAALAAAASLANPFGWKALWQPFQFAFSWRSDPLVRTIGELQPLPWRQFFAQGLFVWPLLLLWRARRSGWDLVETLSCVFFTAMAFSSLRFVATYVLVAAPFVARDLQELIASRRWPVPKLRLEARGALTGLLAIAICLPEWRRPGLPLGIGLDPATYPERACDFMAEHGIRGRAFNHSHLGGYLPYRFWPERGRLPFMSTQPEYTPREERQGYLEALLHPAGWAALNARHRFDYLLLEREQSAADSLLDFLDRDPRWALVFADDAAELLVRRDGPHAVVADSFGYRILPAGRDGRYRLLAACERDPSLRARARAELERAIAASPQNGSASHLMGWLALMDADFAAARRHLERAVTLKPLLPGVHAMLGNIALAQQRPADAIRAFDRERRLHDPPPGIFFRTALAYHALGELGRARAFYRREVARDPASPARDSLAALEGR
jgi:tetratricopeptide (TPR) repeat protein